MKTQVNGNTEGVRDAMLARLDSLYNYELEDGDFLPRELMKILAECSCAMNREIGKLIVAWHTLSSSASSSISAPSASPFLFSAVGYG